jgi:hypothetical protein
MNMRTVKPLVLAVVALGAASLIFIFGPYLPESDEPLQPLPSGAQGQPLPEILALRIGAKYQIIGDVIAGRLHARTGRCALWCAESAPARIHEAVTNGPIPFTPPIPGTYR